MSNATEIANEFLEIASEQRVNMLLSLTRQKYNLSGMAKHLNATAAEIHRNFARLQKAGLIKKDTNGNYDLTLYGKTVCAQMPAFVFMSGNKKYFDNHDFYNLPSKYMQRIGALSDSKLINGYVKVMEKWEEIYKNADKYICNILIEIPYNEMILQILEDKLKHKTRILSVFSESAIISKERQELVAKFDFTKFVKDGMLERKMSKDAMIAIVLNEREAGLSFPTDKYEPDMSKMFYSSSEQFHEWCYDYFNDVWSKSTAFQETKLK